MNTAENQNFAEKHKPGESPDEVIKNQILKHSENKEISCAAVFKIANDLEVSVAKVGKTMDLINFKLVQCQLGLFGYKPEKKIVKPQDKSNKNLKDAIQSQLVDGRLPCNRAWDIAARFEVHKMTVSSVCEALNIKIKPCQLGAF
jgi:hypothetical protein